MHDVVPLPAELSLDAPAFASELDEAIMLGTDPPEAAQAWTIGSTGEAEWAMRKLAALVERAREVDKQAEQWRATIDEWEQRERKRVDPGIAFFTAHLEAFGVRTREQRPKEATIDLPSGVVVTTQGKTPTVTIEDEHVLLDWLAEHVSTDTYERVVQTVAHAQIVELRRLVSAQVSLVPFCTVCGEALDETVTKDWSSTTEKPPRTYKHSGAGEVAEDRYDHEPQPGTGYEVCWKGDDRTDEALKVGTVIPGLAAHVKGITARVTVAR